MVGALCPKHIEQIFEREVTTMKKTNTSNNPQLVNAIQLGYYLVAKYQTKARNKHEYMTHENKQQLYNRLFAIPEKQTITKEEKNNFLVTPLEMYNNLFGDENTTEKRLYITKYYKDITRRIVWKMYTAARRNKDGHTMTDSNGNSVSHVCYNSMKTIVENGFNDSIFDDITQEIALVLLSNLNEIEYNPIDNYCMSFSRSLWYEMFSAIQRYLYRNKERQYKKEYAIVGYTENDDDTTTDILTTTDRQAYKEMIINDYYTDNYNTLENVIYSVSSYIDTHEKPFIAEKCKKMIPYLVQGYTMKEIATMCGFSINSVTKYRNILAFAYKAINAPTIKEERAITTDKAEKLEKIVIDNMCYKKYNVDITCYDDNVKAFNTSTMRTDAHGITHYNMTLRAMKEGYYYN